MTMNSRSSCAVRARLRSRVVPAIELTIARPRPARRLNSVDLPTLARPTSTTVGSPSAAAASSFSRWSADLELRAISEAQLLELARVAGPAAFDPHPQFQKDAPSEDLLEFDTRGSADFFELQTARANHHSFVRLAFHDHQRRDSREVALRFLGELFDHDRGRERNLLAHREEN